MSQVEDELDKQRMRVWVAQKKWKGVGQGAEVSGMGKNMDGVHNVTCGILFACGVGGSKSLGSKVVGSSLKGNGVGRGASACDKRDMVRHSGRSPERLIGWGPGLESVRESPGGWRRSGAGDVCPWDSCGFEQTQD